MTGIQKIIASFISLILLATFLFALPISNLPTSEATLFDHLFTAISFVCVSGLMSVPLTETYTAFGQIIGMIFMQIGGLSLVTILGLIMMYLKQLLYPDLFWISDALSYSNADWRFSWRYCGWDKNNDDFSRTTFLLSRSKRFKPRQHF